MRTNQPAPAVPILKQVRLGTVVLLLTDVVKTVSFDSAMPSTSYTVSFEPAIAIASSLGVTSKTVNGFDLLSVGIGVSVKWKATED